MQSLNSPSVATGLKLGPPPTCFFGSERGGNTDVTRRKAIHPISCDEGW
jgi:hypothetical protein